MARKLGQSALEQRYRIFVALGQLTDARGEAQILHGGHARRCPHQILSRACMIALSGGDETEAFESFVVIGSDRQNAVQQA